MSFLNSIKRYFWGQSELMQKIFVIAIFFFVIFFLAGFFLGKSNSKESIPEGKISAKKFTSILEAQTYEPFDKEKAEVWIPTESQDLIESSKKIDSLIRNSIFYLNSDTFSEWQVATSRNALNSDEISSDLNKNILDSPQIVYRNTSPKKGLKLITAFKALEKVKKGKNWKAFTVNKNSGVALYSQENKAIFIEILNWDDPKKSLEELTLTK